MIHGYLKGVPVAFFGRASTGKSILLFQEACFIASQLKKNILVIGTEGGEDIFAKLWFPTLQKHFEIPTSISYDILEGKTIETILGWFGKKISLEVSDKGKLDVRFLGKTKTVPIIDKIKKDNVGVVVVDSLTNPIRIGFSSGIMNFPARADAECLLLDEFQRLSESGLIVLVSHHASMNPTNPYTRPTITGGINIEHNFKIVLYFEMLQSNKATKRNLRKLWLVRYFTKAPWNENAYINITNDGIVDITPEMVAEL